MKKAFYLKALPFSILVAFILMIASSAQAGIFSDVKLWASNQAAVRQHSRVIGSEVKTLFRERKSIQRFAEGATGLVRAYQAIKNKNLKTNFPQLLEIAKSISNVIKEYKNLAPKAEAMYKNAQPSMKFFSEMADRTEIIQTAKKRFVVKTFSEGRLESLAGANGWNRVFDSVKESPVNLFKWGRLRDEYKLGKIEGHYPLKCAQIAFEASGYYFAAKESVQDLLSIQTEIDGILDGKLSSILNIGSTVDKISNAGQSVENLGDIAEKSANHLNNRMTELVKIQEQYVAANKSYNEKYNRSAQTAANNSGSSGSGGNRAQQPTTAANPSYMPNSRPQRPATPSAPVATGPAITVQKAMANYQRAYEAYVKISENGKASQADLNKILAELQQARQQLEQAKSQAR